MGKPITHPDAPAVLTREIQVRRGHRAQRHAGQSAVSYWIDRDPSSLGIELEPELLTVIIPAGTKVQEHETLGVLLIPQGFTHGRTLRSELGSGYAKLVEPDAIPGPGPHAGLVREDL
jgi:hypothetical protein